MGLTQITTGGVDDNINIDSNTLKVDGTNNRVGINTASPQANLDIAPASSSATLRVHARTDSSPVPAIELVRGATTSFGTDSRQDFRLKNSGGELIVEYGQGGTTTEALRVNSVGRMGIGTASPTHTLHLSGSSGTQLKVQSSASSAYINLVNSSASGGYVGYQGDNLTLWTGATERFRVDSVGRVGIGNTTMSSFTGNAADNLVVGSGSGGEGITVYSATNNQGSLTFADGTSGDAAYRGAVEYSHTNDRLAFRTAGTGNRMVLDSSGNLLIGTTSNARGKLTVFNGDDFSTGTLNDGDNIYLVSDATSGDNVYGASIAFSRVQYADRKAAAIASVQTSSDEDHVGLAFFTHPSSNASDAIVEAMRIKSDGTLHVLKSGTHISNAEQTCAVFQRSSASGSTSKISIVSGNAASSHINFGDTDDEDTGMIVYVHSTNAMQFHTNGGTERMRLDSAGNLGVGSSSPGAKLDVAGNVLLSSANPKITFNSGGPNIHVPAANTLAFNTDGSNERVRIHSLGRVLFGRAISADPWLASGNVDAGQYFGSGNNFGAAINSRDIPLILNRTNTTGSIQEFKYNGSTTGFISTTSSAITISYSSDYRLKENVIPLADAITRVKQLQPKRFNYIIDPGVTVDGFIAHEAQTVVPEAVVGTHNQVDDNGDPVYQGIDPSKMVPLLTAALKEAIAKIETLETKVAALEAAQ